jgi:hypothetical protein
MVLNAHPLTPTYFDADPRSVSMTAMLSPRACASASAVYVFPEPDGPHRAIRARDWSLVAGANVVM